MYIKNKTAVFIIYLHLQFILNVHSMYNFTTMNYVVQYIIIITILQYR